MQIENSFTRMFNLRLPIIMAPMFLVSNVEMVNAALKRGIMGTFPTLNFRKEGELKTVIESIKNYRDTNQIVQGSFGVNLIVQKTNPMYQKHLKICADGGVPFYITSLGNPAEVIKIAHSYGAKVFCDVTNSTHAQKGFDNGCDGFIAVSQGAGGHAGPYPNSILVPTLHSHFASKPVIAAGGVATGASIISMLALGAAGVSIGTRFIASNEASVSGAYKDAVVNSGMEDIVLTERISGTPCTIINTPYAKKIGYKQSWFERMLSNSPRTKKYFKMLVQVRGMKKLEDAVKPGNYNNLWCAGQSVEMIHEILQERDVLKTVRKSVCVLCMYVA